MGPSARLPAVATLLGDSDRSLGEVDAMGFAIGMSIGLLIGLIAIPLPGGGSVELGVGGGPLIAGLVLGTLSRTGRITWQVPHAANLTLRQLGILIFLGSVGIRSGATFADAAGTAVGARLAVAALIVTSTIALATTLLMRILRSDPVSAAGQIAGVETQPAVHVRSGEHQGRRTSGCGLRTGAAAGHDPQAHPGAVAHLRSGCRAGVEMRRGRRPQPTPSPVIFLLQVFRTPISIRVRSRDR